LKTFFTEIAFSIIYPNSHDHSRHHRPCYSPPAGEDALNKSKIKNSKFKIRLL
jgi:hypothetical protein